MSKCEICGEKRPAPFGRYKCKECDRRGALPLALVEVEEKRWKEQITYKDGRYMTVAEALEAP